VADEPPGGYTIGCETRYPEKRDKILAAIFSLILSDFDHVVESRFPILPRKILNRKFGANPYAEGQIEVSNKATFIATFIDVRQNSASVCAGFALGGGHIQRKGVILRLLGVKGRRE
jgi:hypothetical protein